MFMVAGETGESALASVQMVVPKGSAVANLTLLGEDFNEVRVYCFNLEHVRQLLLQADAARDLIEKKRKKTKIAEAGGA
jgi:hypothetical protein